MIYPSLSLVYLPVAPQLPPPERYARSVLKMVMLPRWSSHNFAMDALTAIIAFFTKGNLALVGVNSLLSVFHVLMRDRIS